MSATKAVAQIASGFRINTRLIWRVVRLKGEVTGQALATDVLGTSMPMKPDADLEQLFPDSARELIAHLGLQAALQLCQQFGGAVLDVPLAANSVGKDARDKLADAIGMDAANKMVAIYGGERLYVPLLKAALVKTRNRSIQRDFDRLCREKSANDAVAQLARCYRLSDRHVWRVLKQPFEVELPHAAPQSSGMSDRAASSRKPTLARDIADRNRALQQDFERLRQSQTAVDALAILASRYGVSRRHAWRIIRQTA